MTVRVTQAHNELRLTATRDTLDNGTGAAHIQLRTGTKPTNVGDAATGTLLASIELSQPCGTIASNVLTLTAASDTTVLVDGVAGYARWLDGNGDVVMDTDVSSLAGSAEVRLVSLTLVSGTLIITVSATLG